MIVAADNFTKEENMPYINVVGLSRDIDEQLKHVHKVMEIAEGGDKRKVCYSAALQRGQSRNILRTDTTLYTHDGGRNFSTIFLCEL